MCLRFNEFYSCKALTLNVPTVCRPYVHKNVKECITQQTIRLVYKKGC